MADVNVTSITYGGKEIKSLEAGKTGTVRCKGKKMKTDLVVKAANIAAAKLQEKTLTANGVYPPDSGYDGFSKVTVDVAGKVLPKYDGEVIIEGEPESGGGGGGSAEFNIAYGDTAPSDTSKLWVKANEPEAVKVTSYPVFADEELELGIAALPKAMSGMASAVVGTKVYLFGGEVGHYSTVNTINVFDTETNAVETLDTTLPTQTFGIASAKIGTKVYLFGGYKLNTINVFNTENNTIETLSTTLPMTLEGIASAKIGTKVYLFGGYGNSAARNTIYVFDAESNTITTLTATLPTAARYITTAVVGTKVYLFGGYTSSPISTINVFNTENNTIETLSTKLPTAAYDIAAAAVGTKIYLFGGYTNSGSINTINVFDAESNTIETLSTTLPSGASAIASAVVGTEVYLLGGEVGMTSFLSTINLFTALMPLASNNLLVEASATKNRFNLLPNVELGVNNVYLGNAEGNGEKVEAYLHNGTEWVEV